MTKEIIEMAVAAGIIPWTKHEHVGGNNFSASDEGLDGDLASLIQFANLVAAKEREHYDDLFQQIKGWCDAYPIAVFPEPDFGKAHEVLKANGMTLDAISASNMKHVITQVQKMIDAAIRARGNT